MALTPRPMGALPSGAGGPNPALLGSGAGGTVPMGPGAGGAGAPVLPGSTTPGQPPGAFTAQGYAGGTYVPPAGSLPGSTSGYPIPNPTSFTGSTPTVTDYGTFTAPNPADVASDPYYQFRLAEGTKAAQRSAAANGTLLTGGLQKSLARYNQGLASEEAGNAFNRAIQAYTTNRDTNAQNFGQHNAVYGDELNAFNANVNAADTFGRLGLAADAARRPVLPYGPSGINSSVTLGPDLQAEADAWYQRQLAASPGGGGPNSVAASQLNPAQTRALTNTTIGAQLGGKPPVAPGFRTRY